MKLDTLKTIESALNDAIVAEGAKIRNWRAQIAEIELRDALRNPEIGRGKKLPTRPHDEDRLDIGRALCIVKKTLTLTESDAVKAECERLFELFREYRRKEKEADNRISELRAALKDFRLISWRE